MRVIKPAPLRRRRYAIQSRPKRSIQERVANAAVNTPPEPQALTCGTCLHYTAGVWTAAMGTCRRLMVSGVPMVRPIDAARDMPGCPGR